MNPNKHYPAEIYGFPPENNSKKVRQIRKSQICPFIESNCTKESRLINYPFGVCSTWTANKPVAICPKRFLQDKTVFFDVAKEIFGTHNNVRVFPEVRLRGYGSLDFVLVKHASGTQVEDFCGIELQTDSTTGTGKLVEGFRDFYEKSVDITTKQYKYGMNTYNTIKLAYIQMLQEGQAFEAWKKKIVWVMQDYVFQNMQNRFALSLSQGKQKSILFFIYEADTSDPNFYKFKLKEIKQAEMKELISAFQRTQPPDVDRFKKILTMKLEAESGESL